MNPPAPGRYYDEDSEEGGVWLTALHGYLANITQLTGYSKVGFGDYRSTSLKRNSPPS